MRRKKFLLEKDVQGTCVTWARANGWWARKFSSPANRSVPDYLFAKRTAVHGYADHVGDKFAVEFKAPGKTATEAQEEEIALMRKAGWDVYVIDDIDEFKRIVTARGIGWLG